MTMAGRHTDARAPIVRRASVPARGPRPAEELAEELGPGPFALVMLFASPEADLVRLAGQAARIFTGARLVGCTTAGEISRAGYDEDTIVAVALPASHFGAETLTIPDLSRLEPRDLTTAVVRAREALAQDHPAFAHEFAMLLVDGLSVKEDELASALATGLGSMPLFGGSAGDGTRFRQTLIMDGDRLLRNAAVLSFVRSACPVRIFNLDHLVPTAKRMVVTLAEPRRRIVRRINDEPAAREYARLLGKDGQQLTPFTFAAHPLAVRMGGRHHVRAIQQVAPNGDLLFFCAIDEGVVLTVAEPQDLALHLERELDRLGDPAQPAAILAFDCILRRLEAQEKQLTGRVSDILRRHGVTGFSTYGEQLGAMHVNHTMTGIAFYPPGTALPEDG
ncbi:hypothetical protein FHS82_002933 [Pseudochelatococcus lubricantis]|uniref:GfdT protein n=1 Tax=Pseudochelatococcus lubricantis TaxID=1538102 RepID=A0ABX0V1R8_9HYPH|nr:FIST N-terminal domain-containing protein [Pseudochelatococcus lubricantis]NIJ59078.1 hypothetical protein [Pseudochelatococcus lubricantis]